MIPRTAEERPSAQQNARRDLIRSARRRASQGFIPDAHRFPQALFGMPDDAPAEIGLTDPVNANLMCSRALLAWSRMSSPVNLRAEPSQRFHAAWFFSVRVRGFWRRGVRFGFWGGDFESPASGSACVTAQLRDSRGFLARGREADSGKLTR